MTAPSGNGRSDASDTFTVERLHIEHSVYYALQPPAEQVKEPPALLIAAHGYGQSCKNFIRAFESLRDGNWLVVAPQGPNQFYWDQGKVGFSWMTSYGRENTIEDLMNYMRRLVEAVGKKHPFDERRVFALGFSQGSALAFRFGAAGIVPIRGVVACGGDLPPDVAARLSELKPFPALIVHGKDDQAMSFEKAREGEQQLRDHNFPVDTDYFDGGHELPPEVVARIVKWMIGRNGDV
ncbi:MAG: alpha/beta fold hydrolase [Candidatus Hydrogenedentales bacterium]